MQKITLRLLLMFSLMASINAFAQPPTAEPRKGVVRVKLQAEVAAQVGATPRVKALGQVATSATALDATARAVKATGIRRVFPYNPRFEAQRAKFGLDQWYEITFDESVDPLQARQMLQATAGVEVATNLAPMVLREGAGEFRELPKSAPMPYATAAAMPFNDPRLGAQWHYFNDGSLANSVAGADINLFEAWRTATGSPRVLVAIIDGGIDIDHEDLAANIFVNTAELNGIPGVDDDGNGYVDDIYGYNFCANSANLTDHQHGTHVAGTVAAVNNNGIGVCGIAGGDGSPNSGVKMLSCQVFDARSPNTQGDFAAALVYAAEMGADIAQCSWGWDTDGYFEQDVVDAINYFQSLTRPNGVAGGLCIFAAGNTGDTGNYYPACMESVLSVAAMTADLTPAVYSSYGPWVDVVAPGGYMDFNSACGVLSTMPDNKYGYYEGTSMACPHVAGIAALILSHYPDRSLTPALLKQQIMTSVNDFYAKNPGVEGLFGTGYVDAAKALNLGTGEAPATVGDLTAIASQESITLQWTIPASAEDNVYNHVLYYSTSPFDATTDAAGLKSAVVDTRFMESGQQMTYELSGLAPMTTYYLAIKAVNRWGNASPLSAVITATTNAGPRMTVDVSSLSLAANPDAPVASATFSIGNADEGILKWAYRANTTKATIKTTSLPQPARVTPYSGTLGGERIAKSPAQLLTDDYDRGDYPKEMQSWDYLYAYIGESDKALPNSMAQYFTVDASDYPDGFNLTTLKVQGDHGDNPTIQVYRGGSMIAKENLALDYTPSWFTYDYNITLPEQLYFAPGESFWIVLHFEGNQEELYPLGMGVDNGSAPASQAYMSNDLGASWTRLSEVLKGTAYEAMADRATWCITAISQNPDFSSLITLTPASGQVKPGEAQSVTVANDGQPLCNGTYSFKLAFDTNESTPNDITIPLTLTVSGQKPDLAYNKVVTFGDLIVGQSKTLSVEVFNKGYGNFVGSRWSAGIYSDKIASTSEHFSGPAYLAQGFQARSTTTFEITYAPKAAGSHTGQIVFTDVNGQEFKVMVQGVATDPAVIAIDPESIDLGDLNVADAPRDVQFTISNAGNYPLQYVFPKFSDEVIEGGSKSRAHKFGYTFSDNISGDVAYDGNPELVGATDITATFTDDNYWSEAIPVGFKFPYYGETYDKVYITSFGGIAMSKGDGIILRTPLRADAYWLGSTAMISAYGSQLLMGAQSKIEYAKSDGKFVVRFINVMAGVEGNTYTPISFHMALAPSGDVEIFYDSYDPYAVFQQGSTIFVGINDPAVVDPLTITSADTANMWYTEDDEWTEAGEYCRRLFDGTAIHIVAPKPNIVTSLAPATALVAPGESVTLTATVAPNDQLTAGATFTRLAVMSNDFLRPTAFVQFNANVVGDLKPEIALAETAIDFGNVFRTAVAQKPVTVQNNGRDVLTITAVAIAGGKFTTNVEVPFDIAAGQSKDIMVTLPTAVEGPVADAISIESSAGAVSATLAATVIGCPDATLSYTSIEETLDYGSSKPIPLTVANNGNEPLTYSVAAGEHIANNTPLPLDAKVSYVYASSLDDANVKMEWVDIETTGLGTQSNFTYYLSHDFVEVDLPFDFPFYGKTYRKMWICGTGFVTFNQYTDEAILPEPPADFPQGSNYTNIIAPYWGLHSMDQTKTAGTFYYVSDDQVVVSFMEYGNSMNIGICYQLILNRDGSFKFNYKPANEYAVLFGIFGLAGILNADASEWVRLSERCVELGQAVQFTPVVETTLAPGASATVDLALNADALAGEYESQIVVNTNVPGSERIEIPVALTINGAPKPVFPADIVVEHPIGFQSTDYSNYLVAQGALYTADFSIANAGSAPFTIESIEMVAPQEYDDWFDEYFDIFYLFYYGQQEDWMTGEKVWTWSQYYGDPVVVGTEPVRFSIPMLGNSDIPYTVGETEITLTFHISGIEGVETFVHHTKFVVTPKPVLTLDREEIRVTNAPSDYQGVEMLTITNSGEYRLDYSLYVDPTGVGEEVEEGGGGGVAPATTLLAPAATPKVPIRAFDYGRSDNPQDMPQNFEYLNGLYYPHYPGNNKYYTYGSGSKDVAFKAATVFEAPAEGFNITHIYNIFNLGGLPQAEVKVEVFKGDDPTTNSTVIGKVAYNSGEGSTNYVQAVIPLDHAVYMAPGEKFNVVVTYPVGADYPAWLLPKEEGVVANRYMGYVDSYGWFDVGTLFNDQYGSLGYVMACVETVKGEPWAKLGTDVATGSVEPGQSVKVPININASSAPMDRDNKAMLVIKTNDPDAGLTNLPIYLDKNGAPAIAVPGFTVVAPEGATTTVDIAVSEPDGDAFTVAISDYAGMAAIAAVSADGASVAANADGSFTVSAATTATVSVGITPDFGDEGVYRLTITATDEQGHETQATVRYEVEHSNRAPVAATSPSLVLSVGMTSQVVAFDELFSDPDGDDMSYAVAVDAPDVATAYLSEGSAIFVGKQVGKTSATVTATDPFGASGTATIAIEVTETSGIDDLSIKADIAVWPNPVATTLYVTPGFSAAKVAYELFSLNGSCIYRATVEAVEGEAHAIDVSAYAGGIYVLRATSPRGSASHLVIKQ